jgi:hypothetical protein
MARDQSSKFPENGAGAIESSNFVAVGSAENIYCISLRLLVRSRMLRTSNALLLCSLATLAFLSQAKAQSTTKANDALKAVLLKRGDEFMSAWKKHDSAGIASTLAPDFVAVGGEAMATGLDATMKALMSCDLTSYRITDSALKQLSPTAAVLITKQQQQITCFGHPAPLVMYMTDTYVKRDGKWSILIHIEAAPAPSVPRQTRNRVPR